MKNDRKNAVTIGILFLLAMAAYMPGSELVAGALDSANGFHYIQVNALRLGIVLEFINSFAVVGIASLLFPILRRRSEAAAMAYTAARIAEAVLLLCCSACALLLPALDPETVQVAGDAFLPFRDILLQFAMISLGAGSIFFCAVLLTGKLAPRSLCLLGIVGYTALFVSGWMGLFGLAELSAALFVLGALFEISFPIWLFVKGFSNHAAKDGVYV